MKLQELVLDLVQGGTPSRAHEEYWKGNIPWVTGADFENQR